MTTRFKPRPFLLSLVLLALLTATAFAKPLTIAPIAAPQEIKRGILSFYNPKVTKDAYFSLVHQNAEVILNHLGLVVDYRSALATLPTDDEMHNYRGILTWFKDSQVFADNDTYCKWLMRQMDRGIKVVILEEFGFQKSRYSQISETCQRAFNKLGGSFQSEFADNTFFFEVSHLDSAMVEFERKLSLTEPLTYNNIQITDPKAQVFLKIKRTDMQDSESSLVFTTNRGGYAHPTYVHYERRDLDKKHWRLDPFDFFARAFDTRGMPAPDTTTINGNRIFYTHIDGDGIFNISNIDRKSFSGEVVVDGILKAYPQLPFSVSLITGYFDMLEYQGQRITNLYRDIFSLPNVEPTVHGYAHPLDWGKGTLALRIPGYVYNAKKEIGGAADKMLLLMTDLKIGKPILLYQWTGNCLPSAGQIALAAERNLLNLNGGDSRFDRVFDSVSFVAPIGLKRDGLVQIYASNSNENTYTGNWQGPFYGFRDVIETFAKTETPRRLKPINVYYHFYSAENQASLTVLKKVYDYALSQQITPLYASEFAKVATDFYTTTLAKIGSGYRIKTSGQLKTVRFDNERRHVDMTLSKGVLGFTHRDSVLYVSLDASTTTHDVYLTSQPPSKPYLVAANGLVGKFNTTVDRTTFEITTRLRAQITLGGLKPLSDYQISGQKTDFVLTSDKSGELKITLPDDVRGIFSALAIEPKL